MTITFTKAQLEAVKIVENAKPDKNGKMVTWVNFDIGQFIKPIVAEIAKAHGYHVPADGLSFNTQKSYRGGVGAGFPKGMAAREETPSPSAGLTPEKMLAALLARISPADLAALTGQPAMSSATPTKALRRKAS